MTKLTTSAEQAFHGLNDQPLDLRATYVMAPFHMGEWWDENSKATRAMNIAAN